MGQEWAAGSPFCYFTDHDPELGEVVTEGRRREFRHFRAFQDEGARASIPDPQDPATFERSRLDWAERDREPHASTLRLYRDLLRLRREEPALRPGRAGGHQAFAPDDATVLLRRHPDDPAAPALWVAVRFRGTGVLDLKAFAPGGGEAQGWETVLTSNDPTYLPEESSSAPAPRVDLSGPAPVVAFSGPGAVILRQRRTT
jgi:maltooligosyltrehalose trehalohydrolase